MVPKVTAIVPVYRISDETFRSCCASIAAQKLNAVEVIVVDDSGSDSIGEILSSCCEFYGFKLLNNGRNRGVSYSRNAAMTVACGEYIAFVDADDCVYDDYFSDAVEIADETGADCVIGKMVLTGQDIFLPKRGRSCPDYRLYKGESLTFLMKGVLEGSDFTSKEVLEAGSMVPAGPCGRLYRRSSIKDLSFNESLTLGEDIVFNLDFLERARLCAVTDKVWYQYKQNPTSASHFIDSKGIEAYMKLFHELMASAVVERCSLRQSVFARILGSLKCILSKSIALGSPVEVLRKADSVDRLLSIGVISDAVDGLDAPLFRLARKDKMFLWLARHRSSSGLILIFWLNSILRLADNQRFESSSGESKGRKRV